MIDQKEEYLKFTKRLSLLNDQEFLERFNEQVDNRG